MADVKGLKDRGLPLKIDGTTRFVKGATKYTTCADVIKMVLKKSGVGKEYRHLFAIYELNKDGETALSGKTRILKVAKAWDGEKNRFALRKTNPLETAKRPSTSSTASASSTESTESTKSEESTKSREVTKSKTSKKPNQKLFSKITSAIRTKSVTQKPKKKTEEKTDTVPNDLCDTTSESDSSLEELITGIDRSKMVEFIKFFNAITTHEEKRRGRRRAAGTSDGLSEEEVRRGAQLKTLKYATKRKSTRARSKSRRRPVTDVHPSKMHSVHRLDYGFLDSFQPLEATRSTAQEDIDACLEESQSNFQRSKYRLKRYLRQSHAKSNNIEATKIDEASNGVDALKVQAMLEQSFKTTNAGSALQSKYQEIWNEDFRRENDSDPDSVSSDDSLSRDSVLSYFDRVAVQDEDSVTQHNDNINKLVDYSITDDEVSVIETEKFEIDTIAIGVGYATADTLSSSSEDCCSAHGEAMETSFSAYGYHDNEAYTYTPASDYGEALFTQSGKCVTEKTEEIANTSDYIRSLFDNAHAQTEDEEMDSFMRSKIFDDSLEEGLSWIQSDGEKDADL